MHFYVQQQRATGHVVLLKCVQQLHLPVVTRFYGTLQEIQNALYYYKIKIHFVSDSWKIQLVIKGFHYPYTLIFQTFGVLMNCEFAGRKWKKNTHGTRQEPTCSATREAPDQKQQGEFSLRGFQLGKVRHIPALLYYPPGHFPECRRSGKRWNPDRETTMKDLRWSCHCFAG